MKKICDFIAKWLGVLVLVAAVAALAFPSYFLWIDTWVINPVLGLIMFGMGLTLSPKDFKVVLTRPKDIFLGCLAQFTVMPLLAFLLTWAFSLPKELAWRHCLECHHLSGQRRSGIVRRNDCHFNITGTPIDAFACIALGWHDGRCGYGWHVAEHSLCGDCAYHRWLAMPEVPARTNQKDSSLFARFLIADDCAGSSDCCLAYS